MRFVVPVLAAILALPSFAAQAQQKVGSWDVSTTKDKCAIQSEWNDKKVKYGLAFGYTQKGSVLIMTFMDSELSVKTKTAINASIKIDSDYKTKADGTAQDDYILFLFEGNSPILKPLMDGNNVAIDFKLNGEDTSYEFSLADTKAALGALEACRATAD
jgi:hypothetical protein